MQRGEATGLHVRSFLSVDLDFAGIDLRSGTHIGLKFEFSNRALYSL